MNRRRAADETACARTSHIAQLVSAHIMCVDLLNASLIRINVPTLTLEQAIADPLTADE